MTPSLSGEMSMEAHQTLQGVQTVLLGAAGR
jgi:hypothetical protein